MKSSGRVLSSMFPETSFFLASVYCAFIRSEEITVSIIFGCSESKANAKICSPVMQWLKGEQSTANIVRDLMARFAEYDADTSSRLVRLEMLYEFDQVGYDS